VARKLKNAVRVQGGGGMAQLQETILEAAVAAQGGGGGGGGGHSVGRPVSHKDKKSKRVQERKARKKSRRR
jgi:hypothetical protein